MSNFLAWAGGKSQVLKHLAPHIPRYMRNYYEPFLGGGSVLLYILDQASKGNTVIDGGVTCADINKSLILTFDTIKNHTERVIQQYEDLCYVFENCDSEDMCKKHYAGCVCKECYYHAIRTDFNARCKRHLATNATLDSTNMSRIHVMARVTIAAQFLFLNATCYRGLYRESKAGLMNSCFWTKRPLKMKSQPIREAGVLFRDFDVQFVACSYKCFFEQHIASPANKTDFVLIDPPYIPQSHGDNISAVYHKDGFGEDDTETVIEWINDHAQTLSITYCNHASEEIIAMCIDHWPVIKTYDVRRCLKYSGVADIAAELLITNVVTENIN